MTKPCVLALDHGQESTSGICQTGICTRMTLPPAKAVCANVLRPVMPGPAHQNPESIQTMGARLFIQVTDRSIRENVAGSRRRFVSPENRMSVTDRE